MRKNLKIFTLVLCMVALLSCIAVFAVSATGDSGEDAGSPQVQSTTLPEYDAESLLASVDAETYPAETHPFAVFVRSGDTYEYNTVLRYWVIADNENSVIEWTRSRSEVSGKDVLVILRAENYSSDKDAAEYANGCGIQAKSLTLDLNGKKMSVPGHFFRIQAKKYSDSQQTNGVTLNVKNGTLACSTSDNSKYYPFYIDTKKPNDTTKPYSFGKFVAANFDGVTFENYPTAAVVSIVSDFGAGFNLPDGTDKYNIDVNFKNCSSSSAITLKKVTGSNEKFNVNINCEHYDNGGDEFCDFCGEITDPVSYYTNNGYVFLVYAKGEGEADYKVIGATKNYAESSTDDSLVYFLKSRKTTLKDSDVKAVLLKDSETTGKSWLLSYTCFKSFTLDLNDKTFNTSDQNCFKIEFYSTNESFTKYGVNFTITNGKFTSSSYAMVMLHIEKSNATNGANATGPASINLTFDDIDFSACTYSNAKKSNMVAVYCGSDSSRLGDLSDCQTINNQSAYPLNIVIKNNVIMDDNMILTNVSTWGPVSAKFICDFVDADENGTCDICGEANENSYPAEVYPFAVYKDGAFQTGLKYWSINTDASVESVLGYIANKGGSFEIKLRANYTAASVEGEFYNFIQLAKTDEIIVDLNGFTLDTQKVPFINLGLKRNPDEDVLNLTVKNGTIISTTDIVKIFRSGSDGKEGKIADEINFKFENVTFEIPETAKLVSVTSNDKERPFSGLTDANNWMGESGKLPINISFENCKTADNKGSTWAIIEDTGDVVITITCDHANTPDYACALCSLDYKVFTELNVTIYKDLALNYYTELPASAKDSFKLVVDGVEYSAKIGEKGLYFTFDGIGPHQIGKNITATLVYNGTEGVSKTYSIEEYLGDLYNAKKEENNTALLDLIYDLLVYGQEAEKYQYKLTESTIAIPEGLTRSTAAAAPAEAAPVISANNGTAKIYSANVRFGTQNKLLFTIMSDTEPAGITLKLGDGEAVSVSAVKNGDVWVVETDAISATGYNTVYVLTLANGASVGFTVNMYAYAMQNDSKIGALVKALYNYGASAVAYNESLAA